LAIIQFIPDKIGNASVTDVPDSVVVKVGIGFTVGFNENLPEKMFIDQAS
jgi:hypothetical protein